MSSLRFENESKNRHSPLAEAIDSDIYLPIDSDTPTYRFGHTYLDSETMHFLVSKESADPNRTISAGMPSNLGLRHRWFVSCDLRPTRAGSRDLVSHSGCMSNQPFTAECQCS